MPEAPETEARTETRYKVGEVCRMADVQPYVLRYWENEFPVLAADRSVPGPRTYSERDLAVIQRIKTLLYVEGFTIAGAKKRLDVELKDGLQTGDPLHDPGTAPIVAAGVPPEAPAPEAKPRRTRTRPVAAVKPEKGAAGDEPKLPEIFEEDVTPAEAAPAEPVAARANDPRTGVVAPLPSDPRLPRVVSELRKILEILSREP